MTPPAITGDGDQKKYALLINGLPEEPYLEVIDRGIKMLKAEDPNYEIAVLSPHPPSSPVTSYLQSNAKNLKKLITGLKEKMDDDDLLFVHVTGKLGRPESQGAGCVDLKDGCYPLPDLSTELNKLQYKKRTIIMGQSYPCASLRLFANPKSKVLTLDPFCEVFIGKEHLKIYLEQLNSADLEVRKQAYKSLAHLGPKAAPILPELILKHYQLLKMPFLGNFRGKGPFSLGSGQYHPLDLVLFQFNGLLHYIGNDGIVSQIPNLLSLLESPNIEQLDKENMLEILAWPGSQATSALSALLELLGDPKAPENLPAVLVKIGQKDSRLKKTLLKNLRESSSLTTKRNSLRTIGELGHLAKEEVPLLLNMLLDKTLAPNEVIPTIPNYPRSKPGPFSFSLKDKWIQSGLSSYVQSALFKISQSGYGQPQIIKFAEDKSKPVPSRFLALELIALGRMGRMDPLEKIARDPTDDPRLRKYAAGSRANWESFTSFVSEDEKEMIEIFDSLSDVEVKFISEEFDEEEPLAVHQYRQLEVFTNTRLGIEDTFSVGLGVGGLPLSWLYLGAFGGSNFSDKHSLLGEVGFRLRPSEYISIQPTITGGVAIQDGYETDVGSLNEKVALTGVSPQIGGDLRLIINPIPQLGLELGAGVMFEERSGLEAVPGTLLSGDDPKELAVIPTFNLGARYGFFPK